MMPIYSLFGGRPDLIYDKPAGYAFSCHTKLSQINTELQWKLHDFCRIHQIVYTQINKDNKSLDRTVENIKSQQDVSLCGNFDNVNKIRAKEKIKDKELELEQVHSFVDHLLVVGLWAISEQFLGKIYRCTYSLLNAIDEANIDSSYKWNEINAEFNNIGINLESCDKYNDTNECRVVNNTIKHNPIVKGKILDFPYFTKYTGANLDELQFEMQRYLTGISDFLGHLIEYCDKKINESQN